MKNYSIRDLSIIPISNQESLVIACDSIGGIGPKELDSVQISAYVVGRFLARVPLLELISIGAKPISVVDTLAVEWLPTGEEICRGIKDELAAAGLGETIAVNGSTEENIITRQTGAGITVVGLIANDDLHGKAILPGDLVLAFGMPKVGAEVWLNDPEMVQLTTAKTLVSNPLVKAIVPVGSKGIRYELGEVLKGNLNQTGLKVELNQSLKLDLNKSAGPATVLLAVVDPSLDSLFIEAFVEPVCRLGQVVGDI